MVISFSLEKPREYLINNGYVYTFRKKKRIALGITWFNDGRGRKKIGKCNIALAEEYDTDVDGLIENVLKRWHKDSGFNSIEEWVNEIMKLNKGKLPLTGYIYWVGYIGY